ncbi:phosphoglyceromutase [Mucilaginibacter sp. AW1-3]
MKRLSIILLLFFIPGMAYTQSTAGQKKIIIITFDGLRWKEVFTGADSGKLFTGTKKNKDSVAVRAKFWDGNAAARRAKLMPFLWNTIAQQGQLYGNRYVGSKVNVTNSFWFSYPGYNEIFTGHFDPRINSNDYGPNPNITVQEYINKQPGYQGMVAAFTSWQAFDRILNKERCGFPVNAGYTAYTGKNPSERQKTISEAQFLLPQTFGNHERPDVVTYMLAKDYLKQNHAKVLQISFIETDAYAHKGLYPEYLTSAYNNDKMLADIWNYIQSDPFYKDQTYLFIANDHGRGDDEQDHWDHHNNKTPGSDQIWFAVLGPGIKPLGETKNLQLYQNQYAKTIAALLGINFISPDKTGDTIESVLK